MSPTVISLISMPLPTPLILGLSETTVDAALAKAPWAATIKPQYAGVYTRRAVRLHTNRSVTSSSILTDYDDHHVRAFCFTVCRLSMCAFHSPCLSLIVCVSHRVSLSLYIFLSLCVSLTLSLSLYIFLSLCLFLIACLFHRLALSLLQDLKISCRFSDSLSQTASQEKPAQPKPVFDLTVFDRTLCHLSLCALQSLSLSLAVCMCDVVFCLIV